MPRSLKAFVAVIAFLGIFLIPLFTSSLRGLTHVLTCQEEVATPFTLIVPADGPPQVLSSVTLERGEETSLCGGLTLDIQARGASDGTVEMTVIINNGTDATWQGSASLALEGERAVTFPIAVGELGPGESAEDTVTISLPEGNHELGGSLLIGP